MPVRRVLYRRRSHFVLVVPLLFLTLLPSPLGATAGCASCAPPSQTPNGISVGRPKVFDDRTLILMLEGLSETLHGLQFIDQVTLARALGLQQGFGSSELTTNLTATALPLPSNKVETIATTGNVNDKGEPLPDATKKTTTAERAAFTPTPPLLDATVNATPAGFSPTYGESASDLLSDQVSLTYQIFNLRMLLERSLSDRLLADNSTRLQAVLGINVALDPPRSAADAVAVVEVTLTSDGTAQDGLSLVSLMPQEKTYNSAALSTKSNAFGGAAVVKMIQIGYSQRRRNQIFYLYRDADTISYERMPTDGDGKSVVFGWMFRPVLGRRSVSPGLRQLFAIVALPGSNQAPQKLTAQVRTYWKLYDRDTMTSFREDEATRRAKVGYALSFNLAKPQIFAPRYSNTSMYRGIEVKATPTYEENLRAKVTGVSWRPIGTSTALVSVLGHNFFTGTKVALGDKLYGNSQDSLALKSSETLEFTTTLDALAMSSASVIGRYGAAVPVIAQPPEGVSPEGVWIPEVKVSPRLAGNRTLKVYLAGNEEETLSIADLPREMDNERKTLGPVSPIVMVNGGVVRPPYTFYEEGSRLVLQATFPDSLLENGGGVVRVSWPFLPQDVWSPTKTFGDPCQLFQAIRLGTKSVFLRHLDPAGFTKDPTTSGDGLPTASPPYCWHLVANEQATPILSANCPGGVSGPTSPHENDISVTLKTDMPDQFILLDPRGAACVLKMTDLEPKPAEKPKPPEIKQFDSVWLAVAVEDSTKVRRAVADGRDLTLRIPTDKKGKAIPTQIEVEVTRVVTAQPGSVDLTLLTTDGSRLKTVRLTVVPCLECKE